MTDPSDPVANRLASVRERIRAAGGSDDVRIVAVTKGFPADAVRAALAVGLRDVGENYAQELLEKADRLDPQPVWHFIGRLQSNKVRSLAGPVTVWQSVDRLKVGREIARWAPGATVMVQVNLSGEGQKGGCSWDEVEPLVEGLGGLDLDVVGLMGVAPAGPPESARPGFARLIEAAERLGLPERSIGMTADLEVAVEEGSTMVRIGRDLFGERPPRPA